VTTAATKNKNFFGSFERIYAWEFVTNALVADGVAADGDDALAVLERGSTAPVLVALGQADAMAKLLTFLPMEAPSTARLVFFYVLCFLTCGIFCLLVRHGAAKKLQGQPLKAALAEARNAIFIGDRVEDFRQVLNILFRAKMLDGENDELDIFDVVCEALRRRCGDGTLLPANIPPLADPVSAENLKSLLLAITGPVAKVEWVSNSAPEIRISQKNVLAQFGVWIGKFANFCHCEFLMNDSAAKSKELLRKTAMDAIKEDGYLKVNDDLCPLKGLREKHNYGDEDSPTELVSTVKALGDDTLAIGGDRFDRDKFTACLCAVDSKIVEQAKLGKSSIEIPTFSARCKWQKVVDAVALTGIRIGMVDEADEIPEEKREAAEKFVKLVYEYYATGMEALLGGLEATKGEAGSAGEAYAQACEAAEKEEAGGYFDAKQAAAAAKAAYDSARAEFFAPPRKASNSARRPTPQRK
jgi:hypothetical protein